MTEIQFLISLMLEHKLPEPVKQKFITRIGEVEALLQKPTYQPSPAPRTIVSGTQAPSTQRILDEMPTAQRAISKVPETIDKETGMPIVQTGKGTAGPRKF